MPIRFLCRYCFIEFGTPQAAQAALLTMNGYSMGGRGLKIGTPNGAPMQPAAAAGNATMAAIMAQQQAGEVCVDSRLRTRQPHWLGQLHVDLEWVLVVCRDE